MEKKVDWRGFEFEIQLLDIEQLNNGLFGGRFDVAKCSFHAALQLTASYFVMPSGSALGFGVGPLLLASRSIESSNPINDFESFYHRRPIVLCPGENTTATLLYKLFQPKNVELKQVVFSDIMPQLIESGKTSDSSHADFGVCIHEGRFTWRESGLHLVADLGQLWEAETNTALPLGGLVGSKKIGNDQLLEINEVIRDSIEYGIRNREATLPTMRKYAQEFSDDVLMSHVDLYVNDWTIDLGTVGEKSLAKLSELAVANHVISSDAPNLQILGSH